MNTRVRQSQPTGQPGNRVLVLDSETGAIQDSASVQDRSSYYRYLTMRALAAGRNKEKRPQEAPQDPGQ